MQASEFDPMVLVYIVAGAVGGALVLALVQRCCKPRRDPPALPSHIQPLMLNGSLVANRGPVQLELTTAKAVDEVRARPTAHAGPPAPRRRSRLSRSPRCPSHMAPRVAALAAGAPRVAQSRLPNRVHAGGGGDGGRVSVGAGDLL
jgi:hypothetical protein